MRRVTRRDSRGVVGAVQSPGGDLGRAVPADVHARRSVREDGDVGQRRRVGRPVSLEESVGLDVARSKGDVLDKRSVRGEL